VVDLFEGPWRAMDAHLRGERQLDAAGWRAANLLTVARLVARAALRRTESRGAHYRDDYPERNDIDWKRRVSETI
jgi:succinate dehydrogenase/fumarate reductase flavoprotein subunit